jgi:cell division protein FtsB
VRLPRKLPPGVQAPKGKSESAKDAQIARLKERVQKLEQVVRELQQENELLYGKLAGQDQRRS